MVLWHGCQRVFACDHTRYIYTACLPFSLLLSPADEQSLLRSVGFDTRTCDWQQRQLTQPAPWSSSSRRKAELEESSLLNNPTTFLLPPPSVLVFMGTHTYFYGRKTKEGIYVKYLTFREQTWTIMLFIKINKYNHKPYLWLSKPAQLKIPRLQILALVW